MKQAKLKPILQLQKALSYLCDKKYRTNKCKAKILQTASISALFLNQLDKNKKQIRKKKGNEIISNKSCTKH